MKVVIVSSGNSRVGISPIVLNQGESLRKQGVDVSYYPIRGKGLKGYLSNVAPLREHIREREADLVHAHYSMSGFLATLAGAHPLVVSLMGCDVNSETRYRPLMLFLAKYKWSKTIVKSKQMWDLLGQDGVEIVANGVDLGSFAPMSREAALKHLGWNRSRRHILFAADPSRPEKNYALAEKAFSLLELVDVDVHHLGNVNHEDMPFHYNGADLVILTSLREGSPNVIKEAMACNRPIVSTIVGDVEELLSGVDSCFVVDHDERRLADAIALAMQGSTTSSGRRRIEQLGLADSDVSSRITALYHEVLNPS